MVASYQEIIEKAKKLGGKRIAIAGAEGSAVLEAANYARLQGIMEPILIGNLQKIEQIAKQIGIILKNMEIHDESNDERSAQKAVELTSNGSASGLMKGKVSTPTLLKAVLNKKEDLMAGTILSHGALLEIPSYHRLLMTTDGGMVIQPTLRQKVGILKNGIQMMKNLGIKRPKVAILAAIEKVNPDMPETVDAVKIVEMAKSGEFGDAEIEGPLALDVAISAEAARIKGVKSRISGNPDILLLPNIACGNILGKALLYLANGKSGGLILGAKRPIILLSRSDDAETKFNSIALGVVISQNSHL